MKRQLSKEQLIQKLEGCIIEVASKRRHLVQDGGFQSESGFVHLSTLHKCHLRAFWATARQKDGEQ